METCIDEDLNLRDNFSAGGLLSETVPSDVVFPYTPTVLLLQRNVTIPVSASNDELRVLEVGGTWSARGKVGNRWLGLRGWGVAPEEISLTAVDNLEALAAKRWPEPRRRKHD